MKPLLLYYFLILFFPLAARAQHEADNWYFGKKSGLTFSSGAPSSLSDGQLSTLEGCSAISDATTGALLFYTDGVTVWNSQHSVMQKGTGLKGGFSATQSTLIVPNPANPLQYYLFTVSDAESGDSALSYSIISLETPGGKVLSKNTHLLDGVSEKLTGTQDCAGKGFWVVAHARQTGTFYSFYVASYGIATNPVISRYVPDISDFTRGYMKISPDRTKLALASTGDDVFLALFDFNPNTGRISTYNRINNPLEKNSFYGIAFSPDNTKLYASAIGIINYIYQYEVNVPDSTSIRNSLTILNAGVFVGGLQLAPDGKIYTTQNGGTYLGVINQPNLKGKACGYQPNVVKLSGLSYLGLPNFMDYIFNIPSTIPNPYLECLHPEARTQSDSGCVGNPLTFIDRSTAYPTSREWTFENGTPATSTAGIVSVTFTTPGAHRVRLIASNEFGSDTVFTEAVVYPFPTANASADQVLCVLKPIALGTLADTLLTYSWKPAFGLDDSTKANPIATPSQSTTYILTVSNAGRCVAFDTVTLTINSINPFVSQNTSICSGESTQLLAQGGDVYRWSPITGLDNPTIPNPKASPNITTTYTVYISRGSCLDSATITIQVTESPIAVVSNNQVICSGESTQLLAQGGDAYTWSPITGLDNPTIPNPIASPSTTTTYTVYVSRGSCLDSASLTVNVKESPVAMAGVDRTICAGETSQLGQPPVAGNVYLWSPTNGLSDPTASQTAAAPTATTLYILKVENNGGCVSYDTVLLSVLPLDDLTFTLAPDTIPIYPSQQFKARIHIPKYSTDWRLRLAYDTRVASFMQAIESNGIVVSPPQEKNNTLLLSGTGADGDIELTFMTYLPYTPDTLFIMKLAIDSAASTTCDSFISIPANGNVLSLVKFCSRDFRAVEGTGMSYFLTTEAHSVDFGIGLAGNVRLEVFDDLGRLVRTVIDEPLAAGKYSASLDLPTGVYFWRIRAGVYQEVVSMVVVR